LGRIVIPVKTGILIQHTITFFGLRFPIKLRMTDSKKSGVIARRNDEAIFILRKIYDLNSSVFTKKLTSGNDGTQKTTQQ
jgi:hypothetical protein